MLALIALVFALGAPHKSPASSDWLIPVFLRENAAGGISRASLKVQQAGATVVREASAGTLVSASTISVLPLSGDTVLVSVELPACAPVGQQGVFAVLHVSGSGSVTLRPEPSVECDGAYIEASVLQERVLVPPEQPIATMRSSWSRVKSLYR